MPTLPNVSPELIKAYRNEVARSASPATLKRKNISLNKFFNWAETEGHINKNPFTASAPRVAKPYRSYILNLKSFAVAGMTMGLAILIFAFVQKIQSPIQFIKGLASGNIPESRIQTLPERTPQPTPTPTQDTSEVLSTPSTIPAIGGAEILIEGETVTIKTADGSDGNIEINPDGSGITHFLFEGTGENFLNAQAPNLTSGSLYYGIVANNATGYDLLRLQSGSKPVTRLSVDALGNTFIGGSATIAGNFTITQSPGNFASISKKGSALSNVLNLTLDERNYANSGYSTLVLNRYNGAAEALALLVDEGNARFDSQLQLGRFSSNPDSIGQGSLIFNTADTTLRVWNGTSWVVVAGSGTNADTLDLLDSTQFLRSDTSDSFTSGTLTLNSGTTLDINGDLSTGSVLSASGTTTILFPTDPSAINSYNTLTNGSWLVQNTVNNGIAALMVDQTKGGSIFTASVSGTPKFTIDHDGEVGIGVTAPSYQLELSSDSAAKPTTNTWTIASDERIKNVVGTFDKGLTEILEVNPIVYTYKEDNALGIVDPGEHVGIIAQVVQAIFPEAITTDDKGYLHFNSDALSWASINAIKELNSKIEAVSQLITYNIRAGAVEIDKLVAQSFQTNLISPIPGEDLAVELAQDSKFRIQNESKNEVASIDSEGNATFSGEIKAREIHSENLNEIEALLTQVQLDQSVMLAATESATLSELITSDLYVTTHAAISSLLVNEDLTVENINSLSEPLRIQSLAAVPIELMAGLVKIDTLGNVQIAGNLEVAGKITALEADFEKLSVENLTIAAPTASTSGEPGLTPEVLPGDITTNSTVGKGIIPAGVDAITITNPKVDNYTLIYVTPTSSTQNKVLFVKAKDTSWFSVGFTEALDVDVNFNWWIVETQ